MLHVLDRMIQSDPAVRGGQPHITGTRISVADVAVLHVRLGQSAEEIAGTFALPLAAVHAALAWYFDDRAAIDRSIAADEAFAEAFQAQNPSLLAARLRRLRDE
ncbi:MAG: DUF433 domain-containing protein [Ardenticatenales bacterium]|nr:DUF433 domain-containing protein [Ardenticatenales bacterium]